MNSSFRRAAALSVAFAGLALLASWAVESIVPVGASISVAKKFWRADSPSRLLNSRLFRRDPEFGAALVSRDRFLSLDADVILTVPPSLSEGAAEEMRRSAAFVLAPRWVTLARGKTNREGFALGVTP